MLMVLLCGVGEKKYCPPSPEGALKWAQMSRYQSSKRLAVPQTTDPLRFLSKRVFSSEVDYLINPRASSEANRSNRKHLKPMEFSLG